MNNENIEKILNKLGAENIPADVHKIAEEVSKNFKKTLTQTRQPFLWEHIMKTRTIKFAAAAAIIIAVFIGLPFFRGNGSGVVLADVLERIEQAQAFMYRMKMTTTGAMMSGMPAGKKEMEGTVTISNEYGMKMEMTMTDANTGQVEMNQQMYVIPEDKVMIMVMPEQKKFTRMEFDDNLLARMKKQNNDPRELIKQMMTCDYTVLGLSVIDGIEVEGFETTDASVMGGMAEDVKIRLWVDVETWLPVLQELDVKVNEQMQMQGVVYDFQWDIQVDASEFEPVIPEDFTAFPTEGMKMPSMSEEAAVEGLKFFAEIFGQYPKKLNLMNLIQEFSALKDSENLTDAGLKLQEEMKQMTKDEKTKKTMEMMRLFQSPSIFYMTLVQDKKEPAYYGESVGPDDAGAVLMRWKISDGQYRVIFGDLSALDVSTEELAELEELSPK